MKKTGIIAAVVGAVAVVGGGGWALGVATSGSDETAASAVETVDPSAVPSPAASADPTPNSTPTEVPSSSPAWSESEQIFIDWIRPTLVDEGYPLTDVEIVDGIHRVCDVIGTREPGDPFVTAFPDAPGRVDSTFVQGVANGYYVDDKQLDYCVS